MSALLFLNLLRYLHLGLVQVLMIHYPRGSGLGLLLVVLQQMQLLSLVIQMRRELKGNISSNKKGGVISLLVSLFPFSVSYSVKNRADQSNLLDIMRQPNPQGVCCLALHRLGQLLWYNGVLHYMNNGYSYIAKSKSFPSTLYNMCFQES